MEFSKEIYKNQEESLNRWVKDYAGAILQTCLYLMPDQKQAEDAIQVTLIKAWRYLGNGKRIANERMWLLRIANNTCKDYLREGHQYHAEDQFSLEEVPPKMLCIDSKEKRIMLIVLRLPDNLRKTVLLYYFQGMTKQEMFNPDIDPEVHERLLAMMDWICTEEGQLTVLVGVPGETWEYDAEGNIVMLSKPDESGKYPATVDLYNSYNVFRTQGILADDYSFINPANDPSIVAQVKEMYATRQSGKIIPLDQDYEFFSSDSKANYSLDLSDEVTKLIISKDTDIEAEWKNYIETNKGIWQPVIDDLNAALIK